MSSQLVPSSECAVGVYESPTLAEAALEKLQHAGYGPQHISLIRRHVDPAGTAAKELQMGDDSLHDAAIGGAVGTVAGAVGAATLISVTGVGLILMTGPLVALTGAIVGAFLGAMRGWGIHETKVRHYERLVEAGNVLVIVTGEPQEVERAEQLLRTTSAVEVNLHAKAADESSEVDDRPTKRS